MKQAVAIHEAAHEWPLARTPGFHSLTRTQLVGFAGTGTAVLKVWCACEETEPVATVTVSLTGRGDTLKYVERGRGEIEVLEGIDLQTNAGHFLLLAPWRTAPDGWQPRGPIVRGKVVPLKRAKLVAAVEDKTRAAKKAAKPCACGHGIEFHDPCSKCTCPGYHLSKKTERFARRK